MSNDFKSMKRANIIFLGIAFLFLVMYMPFFRNSVISVASLLKGKSLNYEKWNDFILVNTFCFFSSFCIFSLCYYLVKLEVIKSLSGLFPLAAFSSFFFLLVGICVFHNVDWFSYLFFDRFDTGMDYFHSVFGQSSFYPGLAKLAYKLNYLFVSSSLSDPSLSHRLLRSEQALLFPFVIINVFSCVSIVYVCTFIFGETRKGLLACVSVLLSYSLFFAIERGNIVLQAFIFLLFYVVFYRSKSTVLRELSLVSLSVAFCLKLYPAVFGILLILDRRWRDAFRCVAYALVLFVLSEVVYYFLNGGSVFVLSAIFDWIKFLGSTLLGKNLLVLILFLIFGCLCLMVLTCVLVKTKKNWVRLYLVGLLSVIGGVQYNYSYAWLMLLPSFLYFLVEEKEINKKTVFYFFCFGLVNFLYPLFGTYGSFFLSISGLARVIVTLIFAMIIVIEEVLLFYKNKKIVAG